MVAPLNGLPSGVAELPEATFGEEAVGTTAAGPELELDEAAVVVPPTRLLRPTAAGVTLFRWYPSFLSTITSGSDGDGVRDVDNDEPVLVGSRAGEAADAIVVVVDDENAFVEEEANRAEAVGPNGALPYSPCCLCETGWWCPGGLAAPWRVAFDEWCALVPLLLVRLPVLGLVGPLLLEPRPFAVDVDVTIIVIC